MADQTTPPTRAPDPGAPAAPRSRARRAAFIVLVALASGLVGSLATRAIAQGYGYYGWHGGFRHGWMDPAAIDQRIERGVKHLAIEIDATKEQQDKLIAIAKGAAKDLLPMREKMQAARQQAIDLFAQSAVDRAAVEKLRADQLASADDVSRRITKAFTDAAEVLTPEQRRAIADRIPPPGTWRHPWHRG
jgi:periplasmic protein CpxP/Spy